MSANQGTMGTGSSVPKKRSLAELYNDSFRLPTPDEQALFDGAAEVDFSQNPSTMNEGEKMAYISMETVTRDLILGKLFIVPTMAPTGPFDLEFMSETSWAVFLAEADLTSSGGGFMVKFMGSSDDSSTVFRGQRGIKLIDVPTQFIVAKSTPNGIRSIHKTLYTYIL